MINYFALIVMAMHSDTIFLIMLKCFFFFYSKYVDRRRVINFYFQAPSTVDNLFKQQDKAVEKCCLNVSAFTQLS